MLRANRRGFLQGSAALALGALAPFGARAEARRGGTLRIGTSFGSTSTTLDPVSFTDVYAYTLGFTMGNCLVELDHNKKPVPELAESWDSADGAKRWVFRIRKGVEFHNGKTLTAADVAWSLNRHIAPGSKSAARGFLKGISAIRADGDTLVVEHESGDADIPVAMAQFHLVIVPEGYEFGRGFVGTGPYVLERFDPGVAFSATRNANYWKPDRAWLERVEILNVLDATARTTALMTGEVHGIDRVEPKVIDLLKGRGSFEILQSVGTRYLTTVMDVRSAPFDDPHVRAALKAAIDRERIRKTAFRGSGLVGNDHPVPPSDPFFNSDLPQRSYDPEKVRWHLRQAGHDRLRVDLHAADAAYAGSVDAAVLMQAAAEGTGLEINVVREPNDGYWSSVWMKKPYVMSNWAVRPTPTMMFSIAFACGAPWAEAFWCNERFTKLLAESRTTTDFERRKAMLWELQAIVRDDGGNGIYHFPAETEAYAPAVKGLEPDTVAPLQGARIAERAWMAD
ncbi:peptide/nickel transport system substrate-binding protein [Tistlia consotensis]|uniref:Peptide/nickel transport system substrate-binding protein n=1 Tax=Tistlia consotensis USBA 355 TaxID=560819 RepID=A0A1Y6BJA4_9PROT|nr:ABC transporter substrate-binding protein [Tistlia consotensis]SMF13256.1 peptide/nickel transport system substrate-binding protein [Tistlia consotensis USBA 355]SNR50637.1 peptide/nickel transport system substrate-binding protein [Tistlia consotensis]